jgi:hypothetical protein
MPKTEIRIPVRMASEILEIRHWEFFRHFVIRHLTFSAPGRSKS